MQTMRLFCDVAQCCSFSQAGARHGISQSAVSQRMGQLEKKLGVPLFDRSVRPLSLTEAGKTYWEGCQEILAQLDALESSVSAYATLNDDTPSAELSLSGVIVVDAIYSAGIHWLNDVKKRFEKEWPEVKVQIEYKHPDAVHQAIKRRWCDLGVVSFPDQWKDVVSHTLREETMVLVCDHQHAFLRGRDVRRVLPVSELCEHIQNGSLKLVSFHESLPISGMIWQYLSDQGCNPQFDAHFDNIDTMKSAVMAGDVAAILPERCVRQEVQYQRLNMLHLDPAPVRPLGLIHPLPKKSTKGLDANGLSPLVATFAAHMKRSCQFETAAKPGFKVATNQPLIASPSGSTAHANHALSQNVSRPTLNI